MFIVKMVGKNVTFFLQPKKKKSKKKTSWKSKNKKNRQSRKIRVRHNSLLKLLYSLSKKPNWFLTLVYPKSFSSDDIIDQIKNDINKFGCRLRDTYKKCWFIYSIEHSPNSNIHVHLIGRLDYNKKNTNVKNKKIFKSKAYQWWARIVDSDEEHLSDTRYLKTTKMKDKRIGYLGKFAKKLELKWLIEKFPKQYTHGVINRRNLPKAKPLTMKFSDKEFDKYIRQALLEDANKIKSREGSFHKQKLKENNSGYHIANQPKNLRRIFRKIYKGGMK